MKTRSEAVEYLKTAGFHAAERGWALGETVVAAAYPKECDGIIVYARALYLIPRGDSWTVMELDHPEQTDYAELSLDDACAHAVRILSAPPRRNP